MLKLEEIKGVKKEMKAIVKIMRGKEVVNTLYYEDEQARDQLLSVFYCREFRGTKTRMYKKYDTIKTIQYYNDLFGDHEAKIISVFTEAKGF